VSQIEGGRNEMTVSYKKYCPDDCRKLSGDSARHEKFCHDPIHVPGKDSLSVPGKDTLVPPVKPPKDSVYTNPLDDTCRALKARLEATKPGDTGRAALEHRYAGFCKDRIPVDTLHIPGKDTLKDTIVPPIHNPYEDTCRLLKQMLENVKPGDSGRAMIEHRYAGMCKVFIPIDSLPKPVKDTVKPDPVQDTCKMLYVKLSMTKPGDSARAALEHLYAGMCKEPYPVILPVPTDPKPTVPQPASHDSVCAELKMRVATTKPGTSEHEGFEQKFKVTCLDPLPTTPAVAPCDDLRAKLSKLDPASPDYAKMKEYVAGACKQ
jgi:hypothetical protein